LALNSATPGKAQGLAIEPDRLAVILREVSKGLSKERMRSSPAVLLANELLKTTVGLHVVPPMVSTAGINDFPRNLV